MTSYSINISLRNYANDLELKMKDIKIELYNDSWTVIVDDKRNGLLQYPMPHEKITIEFDLETMVLSNKDDGTE